MARTPIIIRATPNAGRNAFIRYLREKLPDAELCFDRQRDAMDTFLRALDQAGDRPALHLEDDLILTQEFVAKAEAVIADHADEVINFFSLARGDADRFSRRIPRFRSTACFYLPAGLSRQIRTFAADWPRRVQHPTATDYLVDDYCRKNRQPVWLHLPSLVQHREAPSLLGPRSSRRQSVTFVDPWL